MQFDSVDILRDSSMNRMGSRILKRSFDFVFSLVFLCTLFPVILVIVIIVTECTMPGNPFFVQKANRFERPDFQLLQVPYNEEERRFRQPSGYKG